MNVIPSSWVTLGKGLAGLFSIFILLLLGGNYWIVQAVQKMVYQKVDAIEYRDVALVLGTSKSINGRVENPFFTHRITAAAELYFAGKVKHILVSGDNSSNNYNEPRDMKNALVERGVPAHCITMDFAGLRTLDSVVRSRKIFQQKKLTIVSQEFHNYRALFIAQKFGVDAVAYNAKYPTEASNKTKVREYFARIKAILDLYILNTQPKHMGDKIDILV